MKRIALINDISGFGRCSLTAAIPVISVMGLQACPLPTAILSAQTGFEQYFYDDYINRMNAITDSWVKMKISFDGICSGYLGSSEQIQNVLYFLEQFKTEDNIFLADPVMGDNGRCIKTYSQDLLQTMRELTMRADVITPNLTEACLLINREYQDVSGYSGAELIKRVTDIGHNLQQMAKARQTVIITGIVRREEKDNLVGNLVVTQDDTVYIETPYTGKSFSGTGDLFAAVVIGSMVQRKTAKQAVQLAVDFLKPAIEEAGRLNFDRNHGIAFEKYLAKLIL